MDKRFLIWAFMLFIFALVWNGLAGIVDATNSPILNRFGTISTIALTMPGDGDLNPRVAKVKRSVGSLKQGHLLVTNFNKNADADAGQTIMDLAPDGSAAVFSKVTADRLPGSCPGGLGSSTGLAVLRSGWIIVGFMPETTDAAGGEAGCLVVLDSTGNPVEIFSGSLISGPREIAAYENDYEAKLFVTNVLHPAAENSDGIVNQGGVVRLNLNVPVNGIPRIASMTVIASGFPENTYPASAAAGPTGLGLSPVCRNAEDDNCPDYGEISEQVLYVVDSVNNRISVIENPLSRTTSAGSGATLSAGGSLNDPLGLIVAPNGHILTINRADGIITEITPRGRQIAKVAAGQYWQSAWNRQPSNGGAFAEFAAFR